MGSLTYIEQSCRAKLPFQPEKELLPVVGEHLAALFHPAAAPGRSGLYLVSANAGFQSSQLFWSEAQRSGIAVANPELFPWTLANAPCGWLARHFGITGPNFTYTGKSGALVAALTQAAEHLHSQLIDVAFVVALDFAQKPGRQGLLAALRLSHVSSSMTLRQAPASPPRMRNAAATALNTMLSRLNKPPFNALLSDGICAFYFE